MKKIDIDMKKIDIDMKKIDIDMKKITKITKTTVLADIMKLPKAKEILSKYNVPCLTCPMAKYEMEKLQVGQICSFYNIDLAKLLKDLNKNEQ